MHLTARRWSFGSDDFALTATYILGVVFLTAMFGAMATDWDVQSIMWFSCGGFSILAMVISTVLRDAFERNIADSMRYFKQIDIRDVNGQYVNANAQYRAASAGRGRLGGLMPRLNAMDILLE